MDMASVKVEYMKDALSGLAQALLVSIRLAWKKLWIINALAYSFREKRLFAVK